MITNLSPKCLKSVGKMTFSPKTRIQTILDKNRWDIIFIFFCYFSVPSLTLHPSRNFLAVLPSPTLYKVETRKKFWIHASHIVCGVKGGVLDLCELENNLEMQKCPKTFVHDCSRSLLFAHVGYTGVLECF